jgi:hypothetical protein
MRALTRLQSGIIRVENPPISRIEPVVSADGTRKLLVRIRFAFDATKVASDAGRTVLLQMKTGANPALPYTFAGDGGVSSVPSFDTARQIETKHVVDVQSKVALQFTFDLLRALPDDSLTSLRSGYPIEYQYFRAVQQQSSSPASLTPESAASTRDYLIRKLKSGVDPATLRENFPIADPTTTSENVSVSTYGLETFFTRPVSYSVAYQKLTKYSKYSIFERDIEVDADTFLACGTYEFSFLDSDGTPLEFADLSVDTSSLYSELLKLQFTANGRVDPNYRIEDSVPVIEERVRYVRSVASFTSAEFVPVALPFTTEVPYILRRHYRSEGEVTRKTPVFESFVFGLPAKMSRITNLSMNRRAINVPFYVQATSVGHSVTIVRVPPQTRRITAIAKNLTRRETSYSEVSSKIVRGNLTENLQVENLLSDCEYEFRIIVTDDKMREITSSNSLIYETKVPYGGTTLQVSQPTIIGDQTVKFTINVSLNESGRQDITSLLDSLAASGVDTSVLSAYSSDSDFYSNIFSCVVEKVDLDAGLQVSTSQIAIGDSQTTFTDVSPGEIGSVYTFKLGIKSPSSLLPSQATYKWGLFGGRPLLSLPSAASLIASETSGPDFSLIDSGIRKVVYVPSTLLRGSVVDLSFSKTMRGSTLLEWNYSGDITEVDHFQVLGSADGAECLLGCSFQSLNFEDFVLHNRVGAVTYRVRPIYITMEPGDDATVVAVRATTLPALLEESFTTNYARAVADLPKPSDPTHKGRTFEPSIDPTINFSNPRAGSSATSRFSPQGASSSSAGASEAATETLQLLGNGDSGSNASEYQYSEYPRYPVISDPNLTIPSNTFPKISRKDPDYVLTANPPIETQNTYYKEAQRLDKVTLTNAIDGQIANLSAAKAISTPPTVPTISYKVNYR